MPVATRKSSVNHRRIREMIVFAMLGTIMFCGKLAFEAVPNVHPMAILTVTYTAVYRRKALFPIAVFVVLTGVYAGFAQWWIPYIYLWPLLWGVTMLLPKKMPDAVCAVVYPLVCALHGLAYGTLYAPAQVIMYFNGDFGKMIPWIIAGLPFDITHMFGNLVAGLLVLPLVKLLRRLEKSY